MNTAWALVLASALQSPAPPAQPAQAPAPVVTRESPVWTDDRPITRIFHNLGEDVIALPSVSTALILGGGGGVTLAARSADEDVTSWAAGAGSSSYPDIGRVLGDAWIQGSAALLTYGVGKIHRNAEAIHVGGDLIRVQGLNAVLTTSLKVASSRARPNGGRHAFPSGHTSAVFASAAVLHGHYGWKAAVPAYAFSGFIGWTRVRDRSHWLSDIIFGGTIGIIAGRTVTAGHTSRRTWMAVPTATKDSVALYFVKK
jgi:membrane-associated phospholipid phosphatase